MTAINGMMKTDRFAHVLSANERFWRYAKNTRRFFGFQAEEVAGGEPMIEEEEDEPMHMSSMQSSPNHSDYEGYVEDNEDNEDDDG